MRFHSSQQFTLIILKLLIFLSAFYGILSMRARIPQQSLADAYSNEVLRKTIRHKKTDKFLSSEASEILKRKVMVPMPFTMLLF